MTDDSRFDSTDDIPSKTSSPNSSRLDESALEAFNEQIIGDLIGTNSEQSGRSDSPKKINNHKRAGESSEFDTDGTNTNGSLLERIRVNLNDEHAWQEFVERYGPRIRQWCINRKLKTHDAEDVTQEVLLRLAKHMCNFHYDPSRTFRGWLRRITENAVKDFIRSRKRKLLEGSEFVDLLSNEPARTELYASLAEAFDLELLDEAKFRVQQRVSEERWKCWELTANQGIPGKEVAKSLNIEVAKVYTNKSQIQNMIREELSWLEHKE
jgi:RNA polymerase sigma-70 factor (ECF subfamily)